MKQIQLRTWTAAREGYFSFVHLMALPSVSLQSHSIPQAQAAPKTLCPADLPKEAGDKTRRHNPLTLALLVVSGGKVDGLPGRGLRQMLAPACLGQQHERREGEGGTPALSHESSGVSWWQGALRKGAVLSQPKHLPSPTSTQERAALCSGPTQWPSERKVTQMQHPPHPQSNQICSLPWLPHLLSVLGPTWVATASRAICSKTGMPGCCCKSTDTSRGITQAPVTLLRAPTPLPLPLSLSKGQFFSGPS